MIFLQICLSNYNFLYPKIRKWKHLYFLNYLVHKVILVLTANYFDHLKCNLALGFINFKVWHKTIVNFFLRHSIHSLKRLKYSFCHFLGNILRKKVSFSLHITRHVLPTPFLSKNSRCALRTMQIFMFNLQLLVVLYFSLWFECDNQMSTAFHCFHSQTIVANITQPKAVLSTVKIFSVYDLTPPNIRVNFTAIGCIIFFTVV